MIMLTLNVLLLMVTLLTAQTVNSRLSGWANQHDKPMTWVAGSDRMITGFYSEHNNRKEDRIWKFYYGSASGVQCTSHHWTAPLNSFDQPISYKCPHNEAVSGFKSYHDNRREDRIWTVQCCKLKNRHLKDMGFTGYLNDWDGVLNFKCDANEVLIGVYSVHHNRKEDRRWKARCGRFMPVDQLAVSSRWSGWYNDWDRQLYFTAGRNRMITGLSSYHDNRREDRRWKFNYGSAEGVGCDPQNWSGYVNSWDGVMHFSCPSNQALYGVYSVHDNRREDRRWKFRCCKVSSRFSLQKRGYTRYLNDWDKPLNWACPAADEVLVSLYSYHDNRREDRRWKARCAELTRK